MSPIMSRFLLAGSAGLIILATACSGGSAPKARLTAPASVSGTPSAQPPTPQPPNVVLPPTPIPTARASTRCHTTDLALALRPLNSGMGQRYAALDLSNLSGHPCPVSGYVGMLLVDANRRPLPTNVVRLADPRPQVVTLAPGQAAFTMLHWTRVGGGPGEDHPGECEPQPVFVEVTPPDETTQLVAAWGMDPVCSHGQISVVALAPGTGPVF